MGISLYLAMTAAEISACDTLPDMLAYMACHFSPYTTGLSNIPNTLPPQSVLIVNDRTPICGHDHKLIAYQLSQALEALQCGSLLLDFQRPDNPETEALCQYLTQQITRPIGISAPFAAGLDCAVFLPPCPPDTLLEDHLAPWKGREIWLETAADFTKITVDKQGSHYACAPADPSIELPHTDPELICHYRIDLTDSSAVFTLGRADEDTALLLKKAEALGVTQCFGLWQELCK